MNERPPEYADLSDEAWDRFRAEHYPPLLREYLATLPAWDHKQAGTALGLSYLEVNISYDIGIIRPVTPPDEDYRRLPLLREAWRLRGQYLPRAEVLRVFAVRDPLTPDEWRLLGDQFVSDIGAAGMLGMTFAEFRKFRREHGLKTSGRTTLGARGFRLRDMDELACRRAGRGPSRFRLGGH